MRSCQATSWRAARLACIVMRGEDFTEFKFRVGFLAKICFRESLFLPTFLVSDDSFSFSSLSMVCLIKFRFPAYVIYCPNLKLSYLCLKL